MRAAVLLVSFYTYAVSSQPWLIGLLCVAFAHAVSVPAIADPGRESDHLHPKWMAGIGSPDPLIFRASAGGALTYHISDNSKCLNAPKSPFDSFDAMNIGNFGKIGGAATNPSAPREVFAEGVGATFTNQTVKAFGNVAPVCPNLPDLSEETCPVAGRTAAPGSCRSWQAVSTWAIIVLTLTLLTMVRVTFRSRRAATTRPFA